MFLQDVSPSFFFVHFEDGCALKKHLWQPKRIYFVLFSWYFRIEKPRLEWLGKKNVRTFTSIALCICKSTNRSLLSISYNDISCTCINVTYLTICIYLYIFVRKRVILQGGVNVFCLSTSRVESLNLPRIQARRDLVFLNLGVGASTNSGMWGV